MRSLCCVLALAFLYPCIYGQPVNKDPSLFTVEVANGYGGGTFHANDTVHLFSAVKDTGNLFSHWEGDTSLLRTRDWHTWFIMPAENVRFTAVEKPGKDYDLSFENIRGRDILKPVYYKFPEAQKGVVFLFHGSGGSAGQYSGAFESKLFIKELLNAGFAVVITECEEATLQKDMNQDGHRRWNYLPVDADKNTDLANIRIIANHFIKNGSIKKDVHFFAAGMSNGGAFSSIAAPVLNFKAAISFCAQAPHQLALGRRIPLMYAMQGEDLHEAVGKSGNAKALKNSNLLSSAGVCSRYIQNPRSPLYPERFSRNCEISLELSHRIFLELKGKGFLDENNYLKIPGREIARRFREAPSSYPVIRKLSVSQMMFVAEQLECSFADHRMFSDLSRESIEFLDKQCR